MTALSETIIGDNTTVTGRPLMLRATPRVCVDIGESEPPVGFPLRLRLTGRCDAPHYGRYGMRSMNSSGS